MTNRVIAKKVPNSRKIRSLRLKKIGPFEDAHFEFGNLNVFVGPQATGKTIALQLMRLADNPGYVVSKLKQEGFAWKSWEELLEIYLGEGMSQLWQKQSRLSIDSKLFNPKPVRAWNSKECTSSYIPAHRSSIFDNSWPKGFSAFDKSTPFAVCEFSSLIRSSFLKEESLVFPRERKFASFLKDRISNDVYRSGEVSVVQEGNRKKLVLKLSNPNGTKKTESASISFGTWSTGQREFTPALIMLDDLIPSSKRLKVPEVECVVIDEPELGLHPNAIFAFMMLILELLSRGYQVFLSTHSPVVLDIVWIIQEVKKISQNQDQNANDLRSVFDLPPAAQRLCKSLVDKKYKVFYFKPTEGHFLTTTVVDISELDPGSLEQDQAGWGGITASSGELGSRLSTVLRKREGKR
jgi:AAA domain, putative AbiEii toxin, Type IV TA system